MRAPANTDAEKRKFPIPIAFAVILAVVGILALGAVPQWTDKAGEFITQWAVFNPTAALRK